MAKNIGKVSIIVPIYNQEQYVKKSVESILAQSYDCLDIVLVNDGSDDSSLSIIQSLRACDDRIQIVNQENEGLVGAVISGIKASVGDYVCFVDSDDLIGKDFVENFIEEYNGEDFLAMGYWIKNQESLTFFDLTEDKFYQEKELKQCSNNFLIDEKKKITFHKFGVSRCNKFYRSALLKNIIEDYNNCRCVSLGEDSIFTFLILDKALTAKTVKKINSYYYNISSNTSMTFHGKTKKYLNKMRQTKDYFDRLLVDRQRATDQSSFLYYSLGCNLLVGLMNEGNKSLFEKAFYVFQHDIFFEKGFEMDSHCSKRNKIKKMIWDNIKSAKIYWSYIKIFNRICDIKDKRKRFKFMSDPPLE